MCKTVQAFFIIAFITIGIIMTTKRIEFLRRIIYGEGNPESKESSGSNEHSDIKKSYGQDPSVI